MKLKPQSPLTFSWLILCKRSNLHYLLTAIAIATLFPALDIVKFPWKWEWATYLSAYTMLALQSVMVAAVLYSIHSPGKILAIT